MTTLLLALVWTLGARVGPNATPGCVETAHRRLPAPELQTRGTAPVHTVNVWVARDAAPGPKIRLVINTRNVPKVHVIANRTDAERYLSRRDVDPRVPTPSGSPVAHWDVSLVQPGQQASQDDRYFSRQVNLPRLRPGVYVLTVWGNGVQARAIVNITDLAIVVKRSRDKALVWVTRANTGAVVPGAKATFYTQSAPARAKTGADGVAVIPVRAGTAELVVHSGADWAGVQNFGQDSDGQLKAHVQTDRPIYRPGQSLSFKAILRLTKGRGFTPVLQGPVDVTLRDPKDTPLEHLALTPSSFGSVAAQFNLPTEAMVGAYTLVLRSGNQTAYQTFSVGAYRKPEFKVEAKADRARYLSGEDVQVEVNAAYYFGAPVPQAPVRWEVRRIADPYSNLNQEDSWFYGGDGNLYPRNSGSADGSAANGSVVTDNAGKAVIEFKTDKMAPDSLYEVSAVVQDPSNRQVTTSLSGSMSFSVA